MAHALTWYGFNSYSHAHLEEAEQLILDRYLYFQKVVDTEPLKYGQSVFYLVEFHFELSQNTFNYILPDNLNLFIQEGLQYLSHKNSPIEWGDLLIMQAVLSRRMVERQGQPVQLLQDAVESLEFAISIKNENPDQFEWLEIEFELAETLSDLAMHRESEEIIVQAITLYEEVEAKFRHSEPEMIPIRVFRLAKAWYRRGLISKSKEHFETAFRLTKDVLDIATKNSLYDWHAKASEQINLINVQSGLLE